MSDQENRLSRRTFLKGAAVGTAAVAGVGALAGCDSGAKVCGAPEKWDHEADVVIVGGGGAGITAAISAADAGAKVILLEVAPVLGGRSALCVGSVTAPLSRLQKEQGITDSVESYMEDILHATGANAPRVNHDMLKLLAENGGPTIDWLLDLGVQFAGPFEYPGHHSVNRMHMLTPNAAAWVPVLQKVMEDKGVEILFETKGMALYQDPATQRVLGVKATQKGSSTPVAIKANKAVMLTAASVASSAAWRSKITTPEIAALPAADPYSDGTGLMMGAAAGGDFTMVDNIGSPGLRSTVPGPDVSSTGKQAWMPYGIMDAGAILVNKEGKRFVNEKASGTDLSLATVQQTDKICFMIWDKPVTDIFNKWPMVISSHPGISDVNKIGGWGLVDDFVARNGIKVADTIEELAQVVGVDPAGLKATIDKWNEYCANGADPDFERPSFGHPDAGTVGAGIKEPPFYCHSPLRVSIVTSDVSLVINTQFQVLDYYGNVIPGLYAGGENGHGDLFLSGHGAHMSWSFLSGRLGGKNAAEEESWV